MKVLINPMFGWGNDPNVEIRGMEFKHDSNWEYTKGNAGIYWYQDEKTGLTDYFYHAGDLQQIGENHWKTIRNLDGYGGRVFKTKVKGFGLVEIGGPWSGGSYCANKHLPKPATEAGFYKDLKYTVGGLLWDCCPYHY